MMTKRQAIITLLAMPLGVFNAFKAQAQVAGPALLTIDLANWGGILVKQGSWSTLITSNEIKKALGG